MDLLFLNKEFAVCKIVDSFKNFAWNRRYFEPGSFSIELLLEDYRDIKSNNCKYLYCKDYKETAILETLDFNTIGAETTVIMTGRFLETILEDRVIKTTWNFAGTSEEIVRAMVNEFCISCQNPLFNGKLQLGEFKGLGTKRVYQNTGDDIKTAAYDLLKLDGLSYSIDYDYINDTLTFNVWSGLDRTENQDTNSWATFCKNYENTQNDRYSNDESQYKNFAYVAGEGLGQKRFIVEVDKVQPGEERKELYIDARDLQQDDEMTDSLYKQALYQRGLEKLEDCKKVELTEFDIDPEANLVYGRDYDLGDVVMYKNDELDLYVENRIIEISKVYDAGNEKIEISFGDDYNIRKVLK